MKTTNTSPIRILIVDDNVEVRTALADALTAIRDFRIVGIARNGYEGVALATRFKPDVVLLNFSMPFMDGIETTRYIRQRVAHLSIFMISAYDDPELIHAAFDAGVAGYFLKPVVAMDQFEDAIRLVAEIDHQAIVGI
ncbi:MAG: response regulator transcription factor [Aggregatilineales bacterium]